MARPAPARAICILPVPFPGEMYSGDNLFDKLLIALRQARVTFAAGDILVIKHKIVSKAEGRLINLASIKPSSRSRSWARRYQLDPRVVELALRESARVVRQKHGVLITETRHGLICANTAVDVSNVSGGTHALLLPKDPDKSARRLHLELRKQLKLSIPVIITDSFGRPWREGLTDVAIGIAGMKALHDYRGQRDPHGYLLRASVEAVADELAGAAGLVCGKLAGTPVCIIRGFAYRKAKGSAKELIRPAENDLFR